MGENRQDSTARWIGFGSSVAATIVAVAFLVMLTLTFLVFKLDLNWQGIEHFANNYNEALILSFVIPCFLLAPAFLMFTASLYRLAPEGKKTIAFMAVVFAVIYVSQISYNYFMQMSAIRFSIKAGLLDGLTPFAFGNYNSTFWSLEVLGYGFLSASMIFSAFLFGGSKAMLAIRWIFLINGVWGIWAMVELVAGISSPPISLIVFAVTFPISTAMLAYHFWKDRVYVRA